ncbi:hypothetical protein CEXT_754501 [Caerostris extrusa]|uniref:Uncharacterized protein n=1 Tax=Caerostris extrusa TaxID=172846 RepID=A0AAV4NVW6_CAEEX|nr:hypothetical protein CEXT_754501 [Caerostris extrusa]
MAVPQALDFSIHENAVLWGFTTGTARVQTSNGAPMVYRQQKEEQSQEVANPPAISPCFPVAVADVDGM